MELSLEYCQGICLRPECVILHTELWASSKHELEAFGRASRGVHLAWTPGMSDSENTSGLIKQSAA